MMMMTIAIVLDDADDYMANDNDNDDLYFDSWIS